MSAAEQYDLEELASIQRVCQISGLSRTTIYRRMKDNTFPKPIPVGGRSLWPVSWVHGWVNEQIKAAVMAVNQLPPDELRPDAP